MRNSFIIRAIVTAAALCGCLAVLHLIGGWRKSPSPVAELTAATPPHHSLILPSKGDSIPPLRIESLPFVAFDNTCYSNTQADLSSCTGMLSGGEVREYRVVLEQVMGLQIEVEPRDPDLDLSFAVFGPEGDCRFGSDQQPAGWTERASLGQLDPGEYRLMVGGYSDNCGPYLLTVRAADAPIVEVSEATVRRGPNGTAVRWTSFGEVDLAHFSLFRISPDSRARVATFRGHGSPAEFAEYRFLDREGESSIGYELEAVARDGRREVFSIG